MGKTRITDFEKILILQDESYRGNNKLNEKTKLFHPLFKNSVKSYIKLQLQGREKEEDILEITKLLNDKNNYNSQSSPDYDDDLFYDTSIVEKFEIKYQLKTHIQEKIRSFCHRNILRNGLKSNACMLVDEKDELYTKVIKEELSKLAKINPLALEAISRDEFLELLELTEKSNPEKLADFLKFKFRIYFKRKSYHSFIRNINDFENYLELPDFILKEQSIDFEKNILYRNYYFEGNSGSGKTTLVQNIAYKLQKYNVYYIDLSDTERTSLFLDSDIIKPFLEEVEKTNEIVIIDNIHYSEDTLAIAKEFLLKTDAAHCYIILCSQKFMNINNESKQTKDMLFEKIENQNIKHNTIAIDLSEKSKSKSLIINMINYYNKVKKNQFELYDGLEDELYEKFGGILSFLDLSLANSNNLTELKKTDFEDFIIKEYRELRNIDSEREFKLLLLYLSANDYKFTISKDFYDNHLNFEREVVNSLLSDSNEFKKRKIKDLIFKVIDGDRIVLHFPHSTIAQYILNTICDKTNKNIADVILESFELVRVFDPKLYEAFFECVYNDYKLYQANNGIFLKLYNKIAQTTQLKYFLTLKSLLRVLKRSFKLSIETYNNLNNYYWQGHTYYYEADRELYSQGFKKHIVVREDEFIELLKVTNINQNIDDFIEYTTFQFDHEYDYLMVYIYYEVLLQDEVFLNINQILELIRNVFIESYLGSTLNDSVFKDLTKEIIDSSLNKYNMYDVLELNNYEDLIDIAYDTNYRELNKFLINNLYSLLQYNKVSLEDIINIFYELDYRYIHYEDCSKQQKKLIKYIDSICYKYISSELSLILKNYNLITLIQSEYNDIRLFKKTMIYLFEFLFDENQSDFLSNSLNNISLKEKVDFLEFLKIVNTKYINKIENILKNDSNFDFSKISSLLTSS
ncbi:MAG: ATP-binding protein [Arcobacter sp.]|uniref:ATP-binding protein n=1 Tax=Arcobacter sp. TaxID=1872629 RepID=UPI003AFF9A2D